MSEVLSMWWSIVGPCFSLFGWFIIFRWLWRWASKPRPKRVYTTECGVCGMQVSVKSKASFWWNRFVMGWHIEREHKR